jgi:maltose alpha-D-glucosyltransferase/alpha-amylase
MLPDPVVAPPAWDSVLDLIDSSPPDQVADAIGPFLDSAEMLGRRTAEMHEVLAAGDDDPFRPEPFTTLYQRSLYQSMRAQLRPTLQLIRRMLDHYEGDERADAELVVESEGRLLDVFAGVRQHRIDASRIRVHGDYHLGQVLLAQNDFIITDFEGEPARSLAERRQKHSALKDVAGMLRSFNYALFQALSHATTERPDSLAALDAPMREWEQVTRKTFLDTYRESAVAGGLYPSWDEARRLLDLFIVEKACYELGYELANRPDWVRVPLAGLLELMRDGAHD